MFFRWLGLLGRIFVGEVRGHSLLVSSGLAGSVAIRVARRILFASSTRVSSTKSPAPLLGALPDSLSNRFPALLIRQPVSFTLILYG